MDVHVEPAPQGHTGLACRPVVLCCVCVHVRAGAGLKSAGSGRARALHCGLGLLRAWPGMGGGLGVWPAVLAQKPGPRRLGLLGYVVKARAQARRAGLGLGPPGPSTCHFESHLITTLELTQKHVLVKKCRSINNCKKVVNSNYCNISIVKGISGNKASGLSAFSPIF
jgi:hypothetical protein